MLNISVDFFDPLQQHTIDTRTEYNKHWLVQQGQELYKQDQVRRYNWYEEIIVEDYLGQAVYN